MKKLLILFVLLFALHGQAQNVINADCSITLTVTAAGSSVAFDNRRIACTTWHMAYMSTGFTAVSMQLDYSADNAGVPAAWTVWPAADIAVGALPLTVTTETQITGYKYHPWVRITLNSKTGTGTVRALAYGYKPWSGFDSSFGGAVLVDLAKIGGTAVPSTTIGTVAAAGENTAQWIKTYSAVGAIDSAAGAGSKLVPLTVVSTAKPNLKADVSSMGGTDVPSTAVSTATGAKAENVANWIHALAAISGQDLAAAAGSQQAPVGVVAPNATHDERLVNRLKTHAIVAALDTTLGVGSQEVPINAVSTLPAGTETGLITRNIPAVVANSFVAQNGLGSTAVLNAAWLAPLNHSFQINVTITAKTLTACTYSIYGSLDGTTFDTAPLADAQDCSAAATKAVLFSVVGKRVKYVKGTISAWTEGGAGAAPAVQLLYSGGN